MLYLPWATAAGAARAHATRARMDRTDFMVGVRVGERKLVLLSKKERLVWVGSRNGVLL